MKKMIATYALLMVLSMIFVSCEHKELCYSHLNGIKETDAQFKHEKSAIWFKNSDDNWTTSCRRYFNMS